MTNEVKHLAGYLRIAYAESALAKMRFLEAADLIESLSAELEQAERERDAAVQDLNACCPCEVCTRSCTYDKVNAYDECADFQWRGPGGTKK